eukprot:gene32719-36945_t
MDFSIRPAISATAKKGRPCAKYSVGTQASGRSQSIRGKGKAEGDRPVP